MIKKNPGETWKPIQFAGYKSLRKKYAISSFGKAASFSESIEDDGK